MGGGGGSKGASAEERELLQAQKDEIEANRKRIARDEAQQAERERADQSAQLSGRAGRQSLFTAGWSGFKRGGDWGTA